MAPVKEALVWGDSNMESELSTWIQLCLKPGFLLS